MRLGKNADMRPSKNDGLRLSAERGPDKRIGKNDGLRLSAERGPDKRIGIERPGDCQWRENLVQR